MEIHKFLEFVKQLDGQPNVRLLCGEKVRQEARKYSTETEYGVNFTSTVRNRSAGLTVYLGSEKVRQGREEVQTTIEVKERIARESPHTIAKLHEYLKKAPLLALTKRMGQNPYFTPICKLYVSTHRQDNIRLVYMLDNLLFDVNKPEESPVTLYIIDIPEWQEKDRQILVFPEEGLTCVLGTDYFGEVKKGFLRMAMWYAKQHDLLGVHAGSKIVRARDLEGKVREYGILPFGLSGTGKTVHTCHDHGLTEKDEGIEIVQDDFVMLPLRKHGQILGTENAFYLKTDNLAEEEQRSLREAMLKRNAIMENVSVSYDGKVDFRDWTLTSNGRAVVPRDDYKPHVSESINLPPIEGLDKLIIFIITRRNTVVPIASKLTAEQAAAAFMLGESIETTAGDPTRAGESIRVVGTNPFIVGDEAIEGNMFYQFLKTYENKLECYLMNTGRIGQILAEDEEGRKIMVQNGEDITISHTASITRGILRGTVKWQPEPFFGTLVPIEVEGLDMCRFDPHKFYTQEELESYVKILKMERVNYIEGFSGLEQPIIDVLQF